MMLPCFVMALKIINNVTFYEGEGTKIPILNKLDVFSGLFIEDNEYSHILFLKIASQTIQ